jgi:hypothetical protein
MTLRTGLDCGCGLDSGGCRDGSRTGMKMTLLKKSQRADPMNSSWLGKHSHIALHGSVQHFDERGAGRGKFGNRPRMVEWTKYSDLKYSGLMTFGQRGQLVTLFGTERIGK